MPHPVSRRRLGRAALACWAWPGGARAVHKPSLELGVLPNHRASVSLAQYQPMREFLARELARPAQVDADWRLLQRLDAVRPQLQAWREQLLRLGRDDELGKLYFAAGGHSALRPPTPGLLEGMAPLLDATRHALAV